ncbi:hypothetical protein NDU88_008422 [Pleurodeles waltl]|uniref:DUF397 domain-containing protein n=1 Tax=Pleurodeles waltl TaxID=8319 RepID=A0AAV7NVZ0_PLEWA|nr:hypothetical protein NDU88_008422 [Pleurodeles waltl]
MRGPPSSNATDSCVDVEAARRSHRPEEKGCRFSPGSPTPVTRRYRCLGLRCANARSPEATTPPLLNWKEIGFI